MPPSAKKCSGPLPRVVLSSVRLACPPPPPCRPCNCEPIEVCTQGTCADAASCMQTCPPPVPELCPHGLAQREEDCSGGCRDPPPCPPPPCPPPPCQPPPCQPPPPPCQQPLPPPPPPPACPICAQHLADLHANPPPSKPPQTCPAMQPCCPPPPCPNTPQPEPEEPQSQNSQNNSHCSSSCGIMKRKSIDADSNASRRSMPEMEALEATPSSTKPQSTSSCCKSGSGIHAGPHMNPRHSVCEMPGSGKRKPSLVKIESKRRLSLQEPLDKNSGSACQHGAGLFPVPTAPCVCRMPPAYAPVCTGNISGSCKCAECGQEPNKENSKTSKSKKK